MTQPMVQCAFCRHFDKSRRDGNFCAAFFSGIPREIIDGTHDHRRPYKGDHGVRFEPIDDNAAEAVAATFDDDT